MLGYSVFHRKTSYTLYTYINKYILFQMFYKKKRPNIKKIIIIQDLRQYFLWEILGICKCKFLGTHWQNAVIHWRNICAIFLDTKLFSRLLVHSGNLSRGDKDKSNGGGECNAEFFMSKINQSVDLLWVYIACRLIPLITFNLYSNSWFKCLSTSLKCKRLKGKKCTSFVFESLASS